MQLNPSEISELIKSRIQNLDAGAQMRTGQPPLMPHLAHRAVDGHRLRLQQITQRHDQCDIHDVTVTEAGQFGEMVDNLGHCFS